VISQAILFWFLAFVTVASGMAVVLFTNPIYSALSLVMTMVGVSALFVTLGAYFIAGVQLIVYAGAVMVLFVMVLMLFDLRQELMAFSRGQITGALKIISAGLFLGLISGIIFKKSNLAFVDRITSIPDVNIDNTKELGTVLFVRHVFGLEALGILLLVIAVGTVALARSKGGTHAKH
jgi:NADH-quinone oxidoreductase subunit J